MQNFLQCMNACYSCLQPLLLSKEHYSIISLLHSWSVPSCKQNIKYITNEPVSNCLVNTTEMKTWFAFEHLACEHLFTTTLAIIVPNCEQLEYPPIKNELANWYYHIMKHYHAVKWNITSYTLNTEKSKCYD